jgi:hypothetical protein
VAHGIDKGLQPFPGDQLRSGELGDLLVQILPAAPLIACFPHAQGPDLTSDNEYYVNLCAG